MPESRELFIDESVLAPFLKNGSDTADQTKALLEQQKTAWPLLKKNYEDLDKVEIRQFDFDGFEIRVQFNPGRIVSSSAKVDEKSIRERKCFLCLENLPAEQKAVKYNEEYSILCNPFPIFPEHFTLPNTGHVPQRIINSFPVFLDFSRDLGRFYTVFYNGPKCGASAPDHLHFQAGSRDFMPLDNEFSHLVSRSGSQIFGDDLLKVYAVDHYPAKFIAFESGDKDRLIKAFGQLFSILPYQEGNSEEPMLNLLGNFDKGKWRIIVFPRQKHRSSHYFAEGDSNILISPASVDFGGFLITPLEKDFRKITPKDILDIFSEVSLSSEKFGMIKQQLSALL